MKFTKFLLLSEKMALVHKAELGDKKAIMDMFEEMSRLESLIKDYENSLYKVIELANRSNGKTPCPST